MSKYIDADEVIKVLTNNQTYSATVLKAIIDRIPKADVEHVRHGHWIVHERAESVFGLIIPNFECSECHNWVSPDGRGKRCLECGAKMDGKEE